ncbi:LemA family protein [bacterium]|nr:LemA family protein [bacterium]NBX98589.1 LemA family protein [bacterium]NDC94482.1 LemA family protein [bacterium]NDD84062.1 LemA family protein [bacterium]NDG29536.1 LemA family protein [bacterium]
MTFVLLAIAGLLVVTLIVIYNGLVRTKIRVDEAWSDITVQLKRRADLIPNLVETVKGYAKHEEGVFTKVTEARTAILNAGNSVSATAEADNMLTGALKSVFAVAEAYPQLQASDNFKDLQTELVDTEDKIQAARRFYNGSVRDLNTKIRTFPTLIFAGLLGFSEREFFELEESERAAAEKPVDVKF